MSIEPRVNLAQCVDGRWICTTNWVGKQSACKFFEQANQAGLGSCKFAHRKRFTDSVIFCTNEKACLAGNWKSNMGGRRKFESIRKLEKNRPPMPLN